MRLLYICLGYGFVPFALALQLWRGLRDPAHREGLAERLGFGASLPAGTLWLHAVSVGELQAAVPLVAALRDRYPGRTLLVTTSTATGRQRARSLFGASATVRYLPYDLPGPVRRFLERARPRLGLILETELWPNLYCACGERSIPLVLASARVSARSVRRYRLLAGLVRATLGRVSLIAAQSEEDAARFIALGASAARTQVVGNLKFDVGPPPEAEARGQELRVALGTTRPVWVAGSTHAGEEELVLDAQRRVRAARPDALLLLAPRHPPRFEAVAALLQRQGVRYVSRRSGAAVAPDAEVLLVDTLGELAVLYAAADVAFVGGSLVPVGGHNLLEPAALAKPVVTGPFTANAAAIASLLASAGALAVVTDAAGLAERVVLELGDPAGRATRGARGLAALAANRGALARLLALLRPLVGSASEPRPSGPASR